MKIFKYKNVGYKRIIGDTQLDYSLQRKTDKTLKYQCFLGFYVFILKIKVTTHSTFWSKENVLLSLFFLFILLLKIFFQILLLQFSLFQAKLLQQHVTYQHAQ